MKKITLRNQNTFFSNMRMGQRFTYAFSSLCFQDVQIAANKAGVRVKLISGTICEIYTENIDSVAGLATVTP